MEQAQRNGGYSDLALTTMDERYRSLLVSSGKLAVKGGGGGMLYLERVSKHGDFTISHTTFTC